MRQKQKKLVIFLTILITILSMFLLDVPVTKAGGGTSSSQQLYYRFRADLDPLNSAPSGWLALQNAQATNLVKGTIYRVRFTASQEGTAIHRNITPTLEYGTNADCITGMTDVPDTATTEHFQYANSGQYTDGDATTTNLLTAGEPTWQNGTGEESDGTNFNLNVDYYTEYEYAFTITSNATNGGTYYLRMSNDLNSYPACASLTVETPATVTISGNLYSNETGTAYNCASDTAVTIKVATDGNAAQSADCTLSTGAFSITTTDPPNGANSEVVVYVDSAETPNATTVTLAVDATSNITGLNLYQNRVAVTYETGSSITNADLLTADNADVGIRYNVATTALTVDTGMELHVWTGKTYAPGGTVTTQGAGDLHLDDNATATLDTATNAINGDIVVDGGVTSTTLNINTNTTVAGGAITTLDGGGTNATIAYSGTPTVTLTGTGNIGGGTSATINFYNLTIGTATAAVTTLASSATVAGVLDVDVSDSININTSQTLTNTGASNAVIDGNITGAGTLLFTNVSGGPGAGAGTLSAITRFDASAGNIASTTFDARTYSGLVEMYSNSATGRTVSFASGSYILSGASSHLYVIAAGATPGDVTLTGATGNPTVTIGGDLDFTGAGTSAENITSGTGVWTVSGNANFTDGAYTATAGNTLTMDGTGTLTSNSQTLQNLTLSGSGVILAAATHTIAGNLNMAGGTVTATGSTITMTGTSNSIVGGGNTLNILNIDPATAGTITLQTSNLTVGSTLTVAAGDTLTITTVNLTHTAATDVAGTGTISGTGTLIFNNGSGGSGTTITTYSSVVRFDASAGNIASTTFDARTYNGRVEIFSDNTAGAARSVAMAAATYTLTGATSHLYVINDSATWTLTLDGALNPTVVVGGDLDFTGGGASSEIITSGTGTWTVSGHVDFTAGTYTATATNTLAMNGTTKNITTNAQVLQNYSVTAGSITTVDQLAVAGNFNLTAGTLTQGANVHILLTGDAVNIASGATFTKASGTGIFKMDGVSLDQWFDDLNVTKQDMGNVQIGQSPGTTKLKSDFAASSLTILTGDTFETHGWEVDISGSIDVQGAGTFDLQDDLPSRDAGDPTTVTFGGNWTMSVGATFIPFTNSIVRPDGTADQTVTTGTLAFWDFYVDNAGATDAVDDVIVTGAFTVNGALTVNDGELDLETNDPVTDVAGNISITAGAELNASSTGAFNAAGSWANSGAFTANAGTVTFDSNAGSETIAAGTSNFNIVVFNHASGTWTVQTNNMTTNSDLTLTAATSFTVASAITLTVGGNFTLTVAGANTTWTGSTLYLNGSGGIYEINTKTHGGDVFATLRVGTTEDIAMWDSSAGTYTIDAGACLYSQDHAATAGRLNIYGTCNSRLNEYWSYANDFDGTAGANRLADVRLAPAASYTVDSGETLAILGQNATTNRSLITRDSTGNYSLTISGTINAQYYNFDYLDASGLNITSTATITELSDGNFDNAGAGASSSYITVTGITSTDQFRDCVFDDNGDGSDANVVYNVNADGANINWKFLAWDGNKGGEANDNEANGAIVDWNEQLTLTLSSNVVDLGVINTLVVGTGNHNLTVTTNAINGYTCSAVEDGNIRNGANDINDVADNTVTAGSEEYGVSCSGADCQLGANDVALTGTPLTIASNIGRVIASATTVTYEAAATSTTVGTNYSHIVTYTCTGDF